MNERIYIFEQSTNNINLITQGRCFVPGFSSFLFSTPYFAFYDFASGFLFSDILEIFNKGTPELYFFWGGGVGGGRGRAVLL